MRTARPLQPNKFGASRAPATGRPRYESLRTILVRSCMHLLVSIGKANNFKERITWKAVAMPSPQNDSTFRLVGP